MLKFGKGSLNARLNCNKNIYSKSIYWGFLSCTMLYYARWRWISAPFHCVATGAGWSYCAPLYPVPWCSYRALWRILRCPCGARMPRHVLRTLCLRHGSKVETTFSVCDLENS